MAAALLAHHAQGRVHVGSAGSEPADRINPAVIAALAEWDIDVAQEFPKPLTDDAARAADVIVTMGCGDACPVYPRPTDRKAQERSRSRHQAAGTILRAVTARCCRRPPRHPS